MNVLITGSTGFVGPYALAALRAVLPKSAKLIPTTRSAFAPGRGYVEPLDVTDPVAVEEAIRQHRPSIVLHLAAIAAPSQATDARHTWSVNVDGTLNLARAIILRSPDCALINIGTGLVYGESARSGLPLSEESPVAPAGNYAMTKAAADIALGALSDQGLKCVRLRPFNHTGPGQSVAFAISAFAAQIARIEAGLVPPVLKVGNLEAERDFLDVRDVVEAYAQVARHVGEIKPGEVFNVASGKAHVIGDILDKLCALSEVGITIEQDKSRLRGDDIPRALGDASKLRNQLGWAPRWDLETTLSELLDAQRKALAGEDNNARHH